MIRLLPSSSGRVQPTLVPPPHRYPAEEDITQIFWTPDMRRNTTDTSLSCWLCSGILDRYFPSTERDSLKNASWSSATSVPPYHHIPTLITSFPSRVGLQAETVCPRGTPRATAHCQNKLCVLASPGRADVRSSLDPVCDRRSLGPRCASCPLFLRAGTGPQFFWPSCASRPVSETQCRAGHPYI